MKFTARAYDHATMKKHTGTTMANAVLFLASAAAARIGGTGNHENAPFMEKVLMLTCCSSGYAGNDESSSSFGMSSKPTGSEGYYCREAYTLKEKREHQHCYLSKLHARKAPRRSHLVRCFLSV